MAAEVFVHAARIRLGGAEPAAVGAAVTVALCGHWEHEGSCRWPHHSACVGSGEVADFRTIFAVGFADESEVRALIEAALRAGPWQVLSSGARSPDADEREHGARIALD